VYAGADNVIVSFWKVADESTAELMVSFYKNLLSSETKDFSSALQKAKLTLINGKNYSSPYYWAPFVLIGR
jgi:CHAT domain-containing protein